MLSYRHGFHAGNFADVHKYAVLAWIIHALGAKAKLFCVLDTHAGDACYDLAGEWAQKTGEWREGVARIQDCTDVPDALVPYLDVLRGFRARQGASAYPGSRPSPRPFSGAAGTPGTGSGRGLPTALGDSRRLKSPPLPPLLRHACACRPRPCGRTAGLLIHF